MAEDAPTPQISHVNSILQSLEKLKQDSVYDVWIPSLNDTLTFFPLSSEELKDVTESLLDTKNLQMAVPGVLFNLIANTITDKDFDLKKLNLIDRQMILLQIRAHNIDDTYTVTPENGDPVTISLAKHIGEIKEKTFVNPIKKVETKNIIVGLQLPDIVKNNDYDNYSKTYVQYYANKAQQDDGDLNMEKLFGELFDTTLCRYIYSLELKNPNQKILFENIKAPEGVQIFEKLLIKDLRKQLVSDIETLTGELDKITKFTVVTKETTDDKEAETKDYEIVVDGDFFIT